MDIASGILARGRRLDVLLAPANNNLTLFRVLAAIAVIYGYSYALVPGNSMQDPVLLLLGFDYSGSLAVKFFFMLSGLLVASSFMRRQDVLDFMVRRVVRVMPALIACVTLLALVMGPFFTSRSLSGYLSSPETWGYILKNAHLNIQWRLPGVFEASPYGINGSLWTLPFGMRCYILFALAAGLGLLRLRSVAIGLCLSVIYLSFYMPEAIPLFGKLPEAQLLPGLFATGVLLALVQRHVVIGIGGLAVLGVALFLLQGTVMHRIVFYLLVFYGVLYVSTLPLTVKRLHLPFDASYGTYLYGFPVQQALVHMFPGLALHLHFMIAAAVSVLLGVASWYGVEKPSLALGNAFLKSGPFRTVSRWTSLLLPRPMPSGGWSAQWLATGGEQPPAGALREFLLLLVLAVAVYLLALRFVFPGYLDPLWPHHTDFYMPLAQFVTVSSPLEYLQRPRPAGFAFSWFSGMFGLHGAIVCTIIVTLLNVSGTAFLFRRMAGIGFGALYVLGALLYFFLAFTHPNFYIFYSHNVWDQEAYLLILTGFGLYFCLGARAPRLMAGLCFLLFMIAINAKETYGPPALIILAAFILARLLQTRSIAAVAGQAVLLVMLAAGLLITVFLAQYQGYSFGSAGDAAKAYSVDASPVSVATQWLRYASQGFLWTTLALILAGVAVAWHFSARAGFAVLVCLAAGVSAWLPNALLPNHYFPGYAWNGAYLYLLGIIPLTVFAVRFQRWLVVVPVLLVLAAVPFEAQVPYRNNEWTLSQEASQRRMWQGIEGALAARSVQQRKVLVTGLVLPFSPFFMSDGMTYLAPAVSFDVVDYAGRRLDLGTERVHFLRPWDVSPAAYEEVWAFQPDGSLSVHEAPGGLAGADAENWLEQMLYPATAAASAGDGQSVVDYLRRANAYVLYGETAKAQSTLEQAMRLYPQNPYAYFQAGKIAEAAGQIEDARSYYRQAVERNDPADPNPYFLPALEGLPR